MEVWEGEVIKKGDIAKYMTEEFYEAIYLWSMTKKWGLANGNVGWANEPRDYVEIISIIEDIHNAVENEKFDQKKGDVTDSVTVV